MSAHVQVEPDELVSSTKGSYELCPCYMIWHVEEGNCNWFIGAFVMDLLAYTIKTKKHRNIINIWTL